MMNLSDSKIRHYEKDDAQAIDVISIYENNKPCSFNGFFFKGQNEYYFNRNTQSLNYNIVFPELNSQILETKIHTYTTWTEVTELSDLVEISSNVITSINCTISPIIINQSIDNYLMSTDSMFDVIDMMISKNIYSLTTFLAITNLLKVSKDDISLLIGLLKSVEINEVTKELVVTTNEKYNIKYKYFVDFFVSIIYKFINHNTFNLIKKVIVKSK